MKRTKKWLAAGLAVAISCTSLPMPGIGASKVFGKTEEASDDFTIVDGVLEKYNGDGGDVVVPDGVTIIGEYAFYSCNKLKNVRFPDSVTNIGEYAFANCNSLTSITIPEGVTWIRPGTFKDCSSLTSITIPKKVKFISCFAFKGCGSLTSIEMPENIKRIQGCVFQNCSSLTSITIPQNVTMIDDDAFSDCDSLTTIKGYKGSYAEAYAKKNGYGFVELEKEAIPVQNLTPDGKPTTRWGDVNGDGKVNLEDAQIVLRAALSLIVLTDEQQQIANVDKINGVSLRDAQLILKVALNIISLS